MLLWEFHNSCNIHKRGMTIKAFVDSEFGYSLLTIHNYTQQKYPVVNYWVKNGLSSPFMNKTFVENWLVGGGCGFVTNCYKKTRVCGVLFYVKVTLCLQFLCLVLFDDVILFTQQIFETSIIQWLSQF